MAYDEGVAQRLREAFDAERGRRLAGLTVSERKMFGGLCVLVRGHMVCGIVGDTLMARVGPAAYTAALGEAHARPMDFTGKPLKGFVYVDPPGFAEDAALGAWLGRCLDFVATLPDKV